MSGYKLATVTISQEEYQRLHQADMKKRFKEYTKVQSQESGRDEMVWNLMAQLEERERYLQSVLSSMSQSTSMIDEEILGSIQTQNALNYQHMAQAIQNSYTDFQSSIDELAGALTHEMQIERENNYHNLQALLLRQDAALEQEYAKEEAAQSWLGRCTLLVDFIQSQFDHERFAPGRLDRVLRNLTLAENNLFQGFSESCLQQSQQMYLELSDLNLELEQLLLQWQTLFGSTFTEVKELVEQLSSNASIRALGLQGEELPNFVELDYWTNGRYHQLLEHCRQLSIYMYQDQNILTFEDVERIHSQILPAIRESFETIIFESRLNALNSQLRMNIAEKALQALENHGFVLDDAGYTNNDMRSQFNAHLECPDGSQVMIQVLPTQKSKEELANDLVVITTHPYLKTEHEARMHWEELSQTLRQYHLQVSQPQVLDPSSSPANDQIGMTQQQEHLYTQTESS
jgi:hypothetical protein